MKQLVGRMKKAAAVSLAAMMVLPMSASADATTNMQLLDELNDILEEQNENIPRSLLDETLGLEELEEAMDDTGFSVQGKVGVKEESLAVLELENELSAGNYAEFGVKNDPVGKRWQLDFGMGMEEGESLLDLTLYGDKQKLLMEVPQFYEGGLMLQSGSLAQQYKGSIMEQMTGELPQGVDMELDFYPDLEEMMESFGFGSSLELTAEDLEDDLEQSLTVEKREEDGKTVYAMTVPKDAVLSVYREMLSQYADLLEATGMVTVNGTNDIGAQFDEMLDVLDLTIQGDIVLNYLVDGNRVTELNFGMVMDMNKAIALDQELMAEADGTVPETEAQDKPENIVNMSYRFLYGESADPFDGMQILMELTDGAGTEHVTVAMSFQKETTGTATTSTMHMQVKDGEEVVYDDDMFTGSFDASTGAYELRMQVTDEGNSDDTVAFVLDGTFENVVRGQSFDLVIDSLSIDADINDTLESVGVTGKVSVSADPGEFTCPKLQRDVLKLTQEEFINLLTEVQMNVMNWAQQFVPETEAPAVEQQSEVVPDEMTGNSNN